MFYLLLSLLVFFSCSGDGKHPRKLIAQAPLNALSSVEIECKLNLCPKGLVVVQKDAKPVCLGMRIGKKIIVNNNCLDENKVECSSNVAFFDLYTKVKRFCLEQKREEKLSYTFFSTQDYPDEGQDLALVNKTTSATVWNLESKNNGKSFNIIPTSCLVIDDNYKYPKQSKDKWASFIFLENCSDSFQQGNLVTNQTGKFMGYLSNKISDEIWRVENAFCGFSSEGCILLDDNLLSTNRTQYYKREVLQAYNYIEKSLEIQSSILEIKPRLENIEPFEIRDSYPLHFNFDCFHFSEGWIKNFCKKDCESGIKLSKLKDEGILNIKLYPGDIKVEIAANDLIKTKIPAEQIFKIVFNPKLLYSEKQSSIRVYDSNKQLVIQKHLGLCQK